MNRVQALEQQAEQLQNYLLEIVSPVVSDADLLQVWNETPTTGQVSLFVRPAKGDIGKVIGKGGKTFNSVKTLLIALATKLGVRVELTVDEGANTL